MTPPFLSGWGMVNNEWDWYQDWQTGEPILWRTEGWDYDDDYTTYTHYIREGVEWTDGEPFTADDYIYTYNLLLELADTDLAPGVAISVSLSVESVEKIDDYTVVFHLKHEQSIRRFSCLYSPGFQKIGKINISEIFTLPDLNPGISTVYKSRNKK